MALFLRFFPPGREKGKRRTVCPPLIPLPLSGIFQLFHRLGDVAPGQAHQLVPVALVEVAELVGVFRRLNSVYITIQQAEILLIAVVAVGPVGIAAHGHAQLFGQGLLQADERVSVHKGGLAGVVGTEEHLGVEFSIADEELEMLEAGGVFVAFGAVVLPVPHVDDRPAALGVAPQLPEDKGDLLGHALPICPKLYDWQAEAKAGSMINTPNTVGIYMAGLSFKWLKAQGGVKAIEAVNIEKARLLYDTLDESRLFKPTAQKEFRSRMNVTFVTGDAELDAKFVKEAAAAGLVNLKGHRIVGGMRASIYNAMPIEGVQALCAFMKQFEAANA